MAANNKNVVTPEHLETFISETGLRREVFAKRFGAAMPQMQSWQRIGRISKRGYQLLLSLVRRNPALMAELDTINAEIDRAERRRK